MSKLAMISGSSSGIGFEIARILGGMGYDLAISGASDKIHDAKAKLEKIGVAVYAFQADAATYDGVEGFWQFAKNLGQNIDIAVLNVGIGLGGAFLDNKLEDDFRVIAVNISGTVHLAKRVVQHMVPNKAGRIMIVSSLSATTPTPYETVYGPSKAFGFMFSESLREELRDTGVSVTALLPGATNTRFHKNAGMGTSKIDQGPKNDLHIVAQQGVDALMQNEDMVVGGDAATKQQAIDNRTTPETVKAARHAIICKLHGVA